MPPKPRAVWTIDPRNVVMTTDKATGLFLLRAPLLDAGVLAVTFDVTITADRAMRLFANLPEGSSLTGFEAWSNR